MNKMRYRGTPCQFFFWCYYFVVQNPVLLWNEIELPSNWPISHQNDYWSILSLSRSSDLSYNCQTETQKRSDFSGKCQTQLTNLLQTKVEIWVATNWCFLGIFIQFYQVPDVSGKCQTKGFRLVWQMPDSSEYFFWPAYMCQTQLKKLGGNKMIF